MSRDDRLSVPVSPSDEFLEAVQEYLREAVLGGSAQEAESEPSVDTDIFEISLKSVKFDHLWAHLIKLIDKIIAVGEFDVLKRLEVRVDGTELRTDNVRNDIKGRVSKWIELLEEDIEECLEKTEDSGRLQLSEHVAEALYTSFNTFRAVVEGACKMVLEKPRFDLALDVAAASQAVEVGDVNTAKRLLKRWGISLDGSFAARIVGVEIKTAAVDMLRFNLLCHAASARGLSADELMEVGKDDYERVDEALKALAEWLSSKESVEEYVYGVKDGLKEAAAKYARKMSFAEVDVMPNEEDLRMVFDSVADYISEVRSLVINIAENMDEVVERWVSTDEKIDIGDSTFGPEDYDRNWFKIEEADDALDKVAKEVIEKVESMVTEWVGNGDVNGDVSLEKGGEEATEKARSSDKDEVLSELVEGIVKRFLEGGRRN